MADIRINSLSTTASSTASDDFLAVDGSANGTRKLNAYSPTFGGNATVGGTLTVNSNRIQVGKSGSGTGGNLRCVSDDGNTRWLVGLLGAAGATNFSIYDLVNSREPLAISAAGNTTIAGDLTVSSSGTSTFGGNLTVSGGGTSSFAGSKDATAVKLTAALSTVGGSTLVNYSEFLFENSVSSNGNASIRQYANAFDSAGSALAFLTASTGGTLTEWMRLNRTGNLLIGTTTDGGQKLQVNGDATFAGTVTASKAGAAFYSIESTINGAVSEVIIKGKNSLGTAREARLGLNKYADDVFSIYDGTTERFRLNLTNGAATFSGAIAIGNTVNTVSPTSPNRTITMVIGGVTYYLHAKTTND